MADHESSEQPEVGGAAGGIGSGPGKPRSKGKPVALSSLSGDIEDAPRIETGIAEEAQAAFVEKRKPDFKGN